MERIRITNFAGIKSLDIELNKFNVFIGKQASGKSVTAKLIYFFKGVVQDYLTGVSEKKTHDAITSVLTSKFISFFPVESWNGSQFELEFFSSSSSIAVMYQRKELKINFSGNLLETFSRYTEIISKEEYKAITGRSIIELTTGLPAIENLVNLHGNIESNLITDYRFFAPAGRSFFSNLQKNIFTFLSTTRHSSIDPFLLNFGAVYESIKSSHSRDEYFINSNKSNKGLLELFNELTRNIIASDYIRENEEDYLLHEDNRKINLSVSSSGQQETLPLLLMLKNFLFYDGYYGYLNVFIEEPETHLFPSAQKSIVEMMALAFNRARTPLQLTITTHSPYILTSLNNLIQAGLLAEHATSDLQNKIYSIVRKEFVLNYNQISAFAFKEGTAESIIDTDTNLISAHYLDSISEQIGVQFDDLLNLE